MKNLTPHTICAISTPSGSGGIAVVRVSGNEAFEICDKIFAFNQPEVKLALKRPAQGRAEQPQTHLG